jgi:energy-coupling factor transporter ATP-binding protein EcfA2
MTAPKKITSQNPVSQNETPSPEKKKWLGRSFCTIDKMILILGTALIISGVALFILNGLHIGEFVAAATATLSVGGSVLMLGLITHCCRIGGCFEASKINALTSREKKIVSNQQQKPPIPLEAKSTKDFFAEKGIFGLPQELIDEIDDWRKYRTEGTQINLGAGLLLYGPPGTGKTTIADAIAELLGGEYVRLNSGSLKNCLYGGTEKNIEAVFSVPENAFRVVVVDEISGLLMSRDHTQDFTPVHSNAINQFLGCVDGKSKTKHSFILIGTTNHFDQLDAAVVRSGRLGRHFKINNPDIEARRQIFAFHLKQLSLGVNEDWSNYEEYLAQQTDGYSCADIVLDLIPDLQRLSTRESRNLDKKDFVKYLSQKKPKEQKPAEKKFSISFN